MDAKLVLDAAHIHATVALVVYEHAQTASVACACLGAGQHQVDIRVAVSDKALRAVKPPALVLFVVGGLEHHALQVGTCVWLGEVHRHGLACTYSWDVLLTLLLTAEAEECLDAVLQ